MTDKKLTLIAYPFEGIWFAESQTFKYLHPLDGKEETHQFKQVGGSEEDARRKAQAQLDWFMGDRGNCITEIDDFTAAQLAKLPVDIDQATIDSLQEIAGNMVKELNMRGVSAEVTNDAKGLPVLKFILPPCVHSITINATVSREQ